MYINERVAEGARSPDSILAFFIAQRGGSSVLARWLESALPHRFYHYRTVSDFKHWKLHDAASLANYRAYLGFSDYADIDLGGRPLAAFATVRHPIKRLASLFTQSLHDKLLVYHRLANETNFETFYKTIVEERAYYGQNLCTRRIAGRADYDLAIETMEKHYAAVAPANRLGALTTLVADIADLLVPPLDNRNDDDETYRSFLEDPIAERILADNQMDMKLLDYVTSLAPAEAETPAAPVETTPPAVQTAQPAVAAARVAAPAPAPAAAQVPAPTAATSPKGTEPLVCPVCEKSLPMNPEGGNCPNCMSPARTRTLDQLLRTVKLPDAALEDKGLPLLAFATTHVEHKMLAPYFAKRKSVSLFGSYGQEHEEGVDARDLSRYPADSFGGAFSILLFDYFEEHEKALAELYRVLAPGASLFTLILPGRVKPGDLPPTVTKRIQPRPGYFDYLPEGSVLVNVQIGQDWFIKAMARAGFEAGQVRILDVATDEVQDWFVGHKPSSGLAAPSSAPPAATAAKETPAPRAAAPNPAVPTSAIIDSDHQQITVDVDPAFGFSKVHLSLSIPTIEKEGRSASFAEHPRGTDQVIGVLKGGVVESTDLGASWTYHPIPSHPEADFTNCFTTSTGEHLLQVKAESDPVFDGAADRGLVLRLDKDWNLISSSPVAQNHWHGSRSIAEANGVIMFAEYPNNVQKYDSDWQRMTIEPRVFRSRDGGTSWEVVFQPPKGQIRHFHTLVADHVVPGQWWLSSGDRASESIVWLSTDDGDSWTDVTDRSPDVKLAKLTGEGLQSIYRYTDLWMDGDELVWGADDWLGGPTGSGDMTVDASQRTGARIFRSPRTVPLAPRESGWIGNPVRSITDLGPALLVTTEAKKDVLPRPQVCLVSKKEPGLVKEIATVANVEMKGSGLTYSRASEAAQNGTMFSFRGSRDMVHHATRIMRWDFKFD